MALGRVVASLPGGGELRPGQLEMARAVERTIEERRTVVVRAGTGTGKSLAYLVPVVLSGKTVVVATATKALQDQLAAKDLPGLGAAIGSDFSFAVLKGRSNYLCVQALREATTGGQQGALGDEASGAPTSVRAADVVALLDWAKTTTTGDRTELAREPDHRVWSAFSVTSDECPGAFRCPSGGDCFAEAARARAAAADVVVVNLHLLGAHLASGGAVLPEYDALVVDEAHELEDVMSEALGVTLAPGRLRVLARNARAVLGPGRGTPDGLFAVADDLEAALESRVGERLGDGLDGRLGEVAELLAARLDSCERELRDTLGGAGLPAGTDDFQQRSTRALLGLGRCREDLSRFLEARPDDVAWVEGGTRPVLTLAPIDIAGILGPQLFDDSPVVLTSATIPPGLAERLGSPAGRTDELDVGSPFAYGEQALLYCAAHLPDRRRPEAEAALVDEIAALITAAGGRTLALFTSRAAMERAASALRPRLASPILVQGEAGKAALLDVFGGEPAASLFATLGFWQGVDVPGPTLSLVVIDRIPFPRPDEPLLVARREREGREAFAKIDLPRAANLLAQGAGRLIRSAQDRGVVAVLDSRLATAPYRWALVRALPPMRRTKDRAEAEAFLAELHAEAIAAGT